MFSGVPNALGRLLPTVIGFFVRDWRMFQLILSLFMLATCLIWFLLPESPRYLISKGNFAAVSKVLENAAKRNGVNLMSTAVMAANKGEGKTGGEKKEEEEVLEVYGLMDMFRASQIKITIAFFITWPVTTLLYYGEKKRLLKFKLSKDITTQGPMGHGRS